MTKKLNARIQFQENCEYQESNYTTDIDIVTQSIDMSLNVINCAERKTEQGYPDTINYYNDTLEIQAYVYQTHNNNTIPIQLGRIEFYYQPMTSNTPILLNPNQDTCIISKDGIASIKYTPSQSGTIIAKYIDDKEWYRTIRKSINIELTPIPTTISYINKKSDNLYSSDTGIKITTNIKANDIEVLNYGFVIFSVLQNQDKIMIGNPVPVVNGQATIKYTPEQAYNDKNNFFQYHDEIISADYYCNLEQSQNDSINLEYFAHSNINIPIYLYQKYHMLLTPEDNNHFNGQEYIYKENDDIKLQITFNNDNNELNINSDVSQINNFFKLYIEGEYISISDEYYDNLSDDIQKYFIYNHYTDTLNLDISNEYDIHFTKIIQNLRPGEYTCQIKANDETVSNILYINIQYETISYDTTVQINDNNIIGQVHIDNKYKNILNGQVCYFFFVPFNFPIENNIIKYTGLLSVQNSNIIGTIQSNIDLSPNAQYLVYMYIPEGYHANNDKCVQLYYNNINSTIFNNNSTRTLQNQQSTQIATIDTTIPINSIYATPNGTIDMIIKSNKPLRDNDDNILLDLNKLIIYIKNNTDDIDDFNTENADRTCYYHPFVIDDNSYSLYNNNTDNLNQICIRLHIGSYIKNQLLIKAYYSGDNYIQETFCHACQCSTTLIDLHSHLTIQSNDTYVITTDKANDITIVGVVSIYQNDNLIQEKLFYMSNNNLELNNIPSNCTIKIYINAYDESLINFIINNIDDNRFDEIINNNDASNIIQQYHASQNMCLFPLYSEQVITFYT